MTEEQVIKKLKSLGTSNRRIAEITGAGDHTYGMDDDPFSRTTEVSDTFGQEVEYEDSEANETLADLL